MGNHSSKEKGHRSNSRPSTSASNTQPAPYYAYQQQPKLDPRDQQPAPYYYQQQPQQQPQQYPPAKPTGKRRRFGKPKAEYQLEVICIFCEESKEACNVTPHLNGQYTEAYRDPAYRGALKPWELRVGLCWTNMKAAENKTAEHKAAEHKTAEHKSCKRETCERAERVLRKYVGDRDFGADVKGVWCVDDLLRELEVLKREGLRVTSSI